MIILYNYNESIIYMFSYMFIYNLSITIFFWTLLNTIVSDFKNIYSLSNINLNSFIVFNLTTLIMSMAGVPPFIGFFSKLFILTSVVNNNFFLFYSVFLLILFCGLYFYIQNIRFIHSTKYDNYNSQYSNLNERVVFYFFYFSIIFIVISVLGLFYIDDVILIFSWLLY